MVKIFSFFWILGVFFRTLPGSNPLNIIFTIILISSFLFLFFSLKGGRSIGFLWVLVYLGGMIVVFLYLIFLIKRRLNFVGGSGKESHILTQRVLSRVFLTIFFKILWGEGVKNWRGLVGSLEFQEFYRLILRTSCASVFSLLLVVIRFRLFLFLGVLNKNIYQSKISIFFLFIISKYVKFPISRSLEGEKVAPGEICDF